MLASSSVEYGMSLRRSRLIAHVWTGLWCWNDTSATKLAQEAMVDPPQERGGFWLSGYPCFLANRKIHTGSVMKRI
jgi:hypothetical protein